MPSKLAIEFSGLDQPTEGTILLFAAADLKLGKVASKVDKALDGQIRAGAAIAGFEGQPKRQIDVLAPPAMPDSRFIVAGVGKPKKLSENDWVHTGGRIAGILAGTRTSSARVVVDIDG